MFLSATAIATIVVGALFVGWVSGRLSFAMEYLKAIERYPEVIAKANGVMTKATEALDKSNKYLGVLVEDWEEFEKEEALRKSKKK
jgi:phage shock protein A